MSEETYARQHATYRAVDESIILAAKKLIAQQGFRAMNVIDLASEAEVSRATLYNHFRDKEAIGIAQSLKIPQTYFTHISHQLGLHTHINNELPSGMSLAYDGLEVNLP